jgi:hypothetical protein
MVFIDIEKAYDSVPRKLLWQALEQASISEHIIDILKSVYSNNRCQVKVGSHFLGSFIPPRDFFKDAACHQPFLKYILT